MSKKKKKPDFQIFSIFGQIEAAAAESMIEDGTATRVAFDQIPEEERYNDVGAPARFAVVILGRANLALFDKRIEDLRS